MNKLTKLYLIAPVLLLSPMSVTASTGYWVTPDGKDHTLYPKKLKQYTDATKKHEDAIDALVKDIKSRKFKGDQGIPGQKGNEGMEGKPGERGRQGRAGIKGDKGDDGQRGPAGGSFYADTYGNLNMLSIIAVGDAISNMPAPTSNGFFTSAGFSSLDGQNAGAIGLYFGDDNVNYKMTYGRSGREQSVGVGIGYHF